MKLNWLLLIALFGLAFAACKDDDDGFVFDPNLMHLDGVNSTAPFLRDDMVEAAAQFGKDAMDFYVGKKIEAVQFFIYEIPTSCQLMIYGKGTGGGPGQVLYSRQITNQLQPNGWNTIPLDQPLALPSDEIWISIQMLNGNNTQVIGCDNGPAQSGGDWMYEAGDNQWLTFRERSTDNINWNIRAVMID